MSQSQQVLAYISHCLALNKAGIKPLSYARFLDILTNKIGL